MEHQLQHMRHQEAAMKESLEKKFQAQHEAGPGSGRFRL